MLQPGDAEEAERDDDAQAEDMAISDEGYGSTDASGSYLKLTPKNPCAESHKKLFYLNGFSDLEDPNYRGHCLGDQLKLMPFGVYRDWGRSTSAVKSVSNTSMKSAWQRGERAWPTAV